jgi:hypothetical protein
MPLYIFGHADLLSDTENAWWGYDSEKLFKVFPSIVPISLTHLC